MTEHAPETTALSETASIARDLIRFDTSNRGEGDANPESDAAAYVSRYLEQLGLAPVTIESAPGRASVIARVAGADASLPALVLHGHLDVVPADPANWSVDPFAGVVKDGMLWGRGAVDMKDMCAMMLTAVAELLRAGEQPRREVILAFFADEENGGVFGAHYLVTHHPELFEGAATAISEVGGYSIGVGEGRAYLLQVGEKALIWMRLRARGTAGHGSRFHPDNAVTRLADAVARLGRTAWPIELTDTTRQTVAGLAALCGGDGNGDAPDVDTTDPDAVADATGPAAGFLRSTFRTTTNPTGLAAGYKHNVIPDVATAAIDVRTLPGQEDAVLAEIQRIVGDDIVIEVVHRDIGLEVPFAGDLVEAMVDALGRHDPGIPVVPYLMGGGTDNKALAELGIAGYGFAPLRLPRDLDFTGMFHGVDERVPIDALVFGQRVLVDLLRSY